MKEKEKYEIMVVGLMVFLAFMAFAYPVFIGMVGNPHDIEWFGWKALFWDFTVIPLTGLLFYSLHRLQKVKHS